MAIYNTKEYMIEELCSIGIKKDSFTKLSELQQKCSGCNFLLAEHEENCADCYNQEFDANVANIFIHLRRKSLAEI